MFINRLFWTRLRYWSVHALLCATPSFVLAYAGGYNSNSAITGMLLGIASFIVLYASLTSSKIYCQRVSGSVLGRAVHAAAILRSSIAFGGIVGWLTPANLPLVGLLLIPDLYAGAFSIELVEYISGWAGGPAAGTEGLATLGLTYLTTVTEGVLLSGGLFILVLLCLAILHAARRFRGSAAAVL